MILLVGSLQLLVEVGNSKLGLSIVANHVDRLLDSLVVSVAVGAVILHSLSASVEVGSGIEVCRGSGVAFLLSVVLRDGSIQSCESSTSITLSSIVFANDLGICQRLVQLLSFLDTNLVGNVSHLDIT